MTTNAGAIYSIEHTIVTLNGHTIEGWGDEAAAIEFPEMEVTDWVYSPDGKMMGTRSGQKGGAMTFRIQANSISSAWFARKFQKYLHNDGAPERFDGTYENTNMGISATLTNGYFTSGPGGQNIGTEAAVQEYVLNFEQIRMNMDGNTFTPVPRTNG